MKKALRVFIKLNINILPYLLLFLYLFPKTSLAACGGDKVPTAVGCVPKNPYAAANWIYQAALGISSGIAFLLILFGGVKYITAQGDPKAMGEAQKTITSAIAGFLVIFLSVLLLSIVGGDKILGIPSWSRFFGP